MRAYLASGLLVVLTALLWLATGIQREKPVVPRDRQAVEILEHQVSACPNEASRLRELAQAYVDRGAPGLAIGLLEGAPEAVQGDFLGQHLYGWALVQEGRASDALTAESEVLRGCSAINSPISRTNARCSTWLPVAAARRWQILEQLVKMGVEDAPAHPEATLVAYRNATRDVRVGL